MAQGKFKVKNKAPVDVKKRTKTIARKNCPVAPTKWKYVEGQRIKKLITKNVNKKIEEEIHGIVCNTPVVIDKKKKKQPQKKSNHVQPAQISLARIPRKSSAKLPPL